MPDSAPPSPGGHRGPSDGQPPVRPTQARLQVCFLRHVALSGSVGDAAARAGITPRTVQRWRAANPAFARRYGEVLAQRVELLEDLAMRRVRVQMLVGADDTESWEITIKPGDAAWMEGANDTGRTRIDRLATLRANYEKHGIAVRHDLLPGLGHSGPSALQPVIEFFGQVLTETAK